MARMGRYDLLRAIQALAQKLAKWDELCDRKMLRIIQYLKHTKSVRQIGFVGDPTDEISISVFTDADFAASREDMKSTSGVFVCLHGPNTFYPLSVFSKKQTCISHSTVEPELVSGCDGLRRSIFPIMSLWELLVSLVKTKPVLITSYVDMWQDNQSTGRIMRTGIAGQSLRHVGRQHAVSITWIAEIIKLKNILVLDCASRAMAADIFTKFFTSAVKWAAAKC